MRRHWAFLHSLLLCVLVSNVTSAQSLDIKDAASRAAQGVGIVGEVFNGIRATAPLFVFQEDHASRVGQLQIAVMLNRLYNKYGLRRIGLEGFTKPTGYLNADWFIRATSDTNIRQDVALRMLGEGEVSSAEFMALVYGDVRVFGIDDEKWTQP